MRWPATQLEGLEVARLTRARKDVRLEWPWRADRAPVAPTIAAFGVPMLGGLTWVLAAGELWGAAALFGLVALAMAYAALVFFVNRTTLRLTPEKMTLSDGPLPWREAIYPVIFTVGMRAVTRRAVSVETRIRWEGSHRYTLHEVALEGEDGKRRVWVTKDARLSLDLCRALGAVYGFESRSPSGRDSS